MVLTIFAIAAFFLLLERIAPDQRLPNVRGWWWRVVLFNGGQLGGVLLAGVTWDRYLQRVSVLHLGEAMPPLLGALLAYLATTFIYYWWHRLRHDWNFLWLLCHQMHHSPARIEAVTAFYKHPVEVVCNSILSSAISYTLFGLTIEGAAWVAVISAAAEFFYHMNVATPRWIGYFVQRPEMHRIHHQRGRHYDNFGDLPLWDILFGTFRNPPTYAGECGYEAERELALGKMLLFRDVNGPLSIRPAREC